jgi:hypothetical protein
MVLYVSGGLGNEEVLLSNVAVAVHSAALEEAVTNHA